MRARAAPQSCGEWIAGSASASGIRSYCCKQRLGKYFLQHVAELLDRAGDHAPHLILREALGERIQRQQPHLRLVLGAVEPRDARVGHLPAAAAEPRLGGEQHVLALAKFLAHERLVEPDRPQIVVALPHQHADDALAEAAAAGVDFDDLAADRLHVPFFQVGDLAAVGEILVIARKEEDQVAGRADVEPAPASSARCGPTPRTNSTGVASTSAGVGWRLRRFACGDFGECRSCRHCTATHDRRESSECRERTFGLAADAWLGLSPRYRYC